MSAPVRTPATRAERLVLVVALLLSASLAWPLRGYLTDDTFIHLQYARHVAEGQGFVFNPGEPVYGSTSPLWVMLLAQAIAVGFDGVLAGKVLGAVALLASVALWWALARRTLGSPWLRALGTLAWATHAWMLRWSLSGMETPLAVALVLGGLVLFTATEPWGERAGPVSLLWALAALARPECLLLLVLWGAFTLADHGPVAGLRRALRSMWPGLLVQGAWLVFARWHFGAFWPNTLAAKVAGGVGLEYQLEQALRQVAVIGVTEGWAVALLALAGLLGAIRRSVPGVRASVRFTPWAWVVAVPVLYAVRGVPVLSRYLVPLLPVLAWLAWRVLDRALGPRAERPEDPALRHRRLLLIGCCAALLAFTQNAYTYTRLVLPQVRSFSSGLEGSLVRWGRWFGEHTPPDAVVAAPDIGAIGYYSQRRVVDLAGLVTPEMVPVLRELPPEVAVARFAFARFSRPDYLVDRAPVAWDLQRRSPWAAALVPLGADSVPNLGVARPDPAVYSVYRIDWTAYDSLSTSR